MEITKPNDILVATMNNPTASSYDLMTLDLSPENTSLMTKDAYKSSKLIQDTFKTDDGKFNEVAFNDMYNKAASHYNDMADKTYLKGLDEITYSPFDVTRPKNAKTFQVSTEFTKDYNPFKQLYSRTGVNSIDDNQLSLREIAQQNKIFDTKTGTWSDKSTNDIGLLDKVFGETLVYAQWDVEGTHIDPETGKTIKHAKGDWKINDDGNIFIETLGNREMYGKQIVNPKDILTTDGSFANNLDFFDNDNKESNAIKTTIRLAAEIAPFLIPGVNTYYGGVKAAVGLAAVLPTFYKSLEGLILGDNKSGLTNSATAAENYLAKFTQSSISDESQGSMFNYEQLGTMVSSIFSQIYEQRAMASLSKYFVQAKTAALTAKEAEIGAAMDKGLLDAAKSGKLKLLNQSGELSDEAGALIKAAQSKLPELESLQKLQSGIAKSLSLGYMAMTSTADIYGQALEAGYDRRTAGFASLLAASGQYGIMMNNRMGDWFLDKTTGYTTETNKTLLRQSVKGYLEDIKTGFTTFGKNNVEGKLKLAQVAKNFKTKLVDTFTNGSILGENMLKNSMIEGVEEVTEQVVLDATKGIVDVMSYLGMTKKQGNFNTVDKVFSAEGGQEYLANFIGGLLGGAMFEFNASKLEPMLNPNMVSPDVKKSIYQYVANGHTDLLIDELNKQRSRLGNNYLSPVQVDGKFLSADKGKSQADFITDTAIGMIKNIEGRLNAKGLAKTDAEIIERTMMDHLAIQIFENSKGTGKIGIEGLIIDDFRTKSAALLEVDKKIEDLLKIENYDKNELSELKEEAKFYETELQDMVDGKKAEDYFNQISLYFEKNISEAWMTIDRDSYTKANYGRSFESLNEKGAGLTKEKVDKEWKEYLDNTNIREKISIATKAYLDYEKQANPTIRKYIESGYSEEHKKSLENIIQMASTFDLFDISDPETKKAKLTSYIQTAKNTEERTGKRIIPWDVLSTNFIDSFLNQNLLVGKDPKSFMTREERLANQVTLTSDDLTKVIKTTDGQEIETLQFIKNLLTTVLSSHPSTNFNYQNIQNDFNYEIVNYNDSLNTKIATLQGTITEENEVEVTDKIEALKNAKLNVYLGGYDSTESYKNLETNINKDLDKEKKRLDLDDKYITYYNSITNKHTLEVPELTQDTELDTIEARVAEFINLQKAFNNGSTIEATLFKYANNPTAENFKEFKKEVTEYIKYFNTKAKNVDEYIKTYNDKIRELNETAPEFFSNEGHNYALPAIIKEIKSNKNLDKELLVLLKGMIIDFTLPVKNILKDYVISDDEVLDLLKNNSSYYSEILSSFKDEGETTTPEEYVSIIQSKNFPSYLQKLLLVKKVNGDIDANLSREQGVKFSIELLTLTEFAKLHETDLKNIEELIEIFNDSDKFISNSIYDFIGNFNVTLDDDNWKLRKSTILKILKAEELSLTKASDITNYLSEGVRTKDMTQMINTIELLKSVVTAMSTTEISLDASSNGFVAMRQSFVERNKIKSDVTNLKTVSSDIATMMLNDLQRVKVKLEFLRDLTKFNSGRLFNESEEIRSKATKLFHDEWKNLASKNIIFKEKPVIPDLGEILNNGKTIEEQLLQIKSSFFEHHKTLNKEDKIDMLKLLLQEYLPFTSNYDNLYNIDGSNEFTKEIRGLSNFDFFMSLVTASVVHAKDLQIKLLNNLKGEFDKAPFYTQEIVAETTYASIVAPEIFAAMIEATAHEDTQITDYITYILGNAGTGKTTVEYKLLLLMLEKNNPNLKVWFAAPHIDQANKLQKDVTDGITVDKFNLFAFNKAQLFEKLGLAEIAEKIANLDPSLVIKESSDIIYNLNLENVVFEGLENTDLPNLILIDEITHFNALELKLLNEFVKKLYNNGEGKYIKIIGAGDPTQRGARIENINYNIDRVSGVFTPQLNLTVRASNNQKRDNNDSLANLTKKAIKAYYLPSDSKKVVDLLGDGVVFKYYIDNFTLNGDYLTDDSTLPQTVIDTLKNIIIKTSTIKIGILTSSGELDVKLKEKFDKAGITEANYKLYTPKNVQGAEADYFIFNLSEIKDNHIVSSLKNLYTYSTRAKNGTIIINDGLKPNDDDTIIPIINIKEDTTEPVEPLSKDLIKEIKDGKIEYLTKLLGDDLKIQYDNFKFDNEAVSIIDDEIDSHIEINSETEFIEEPTTKEPVIVDGVLPDSSQIMVHSFYNDLNVAYTIENGIATISRNSKQPNMGLSFLNWDSNDQTTMTEVEFEKLTARLISLKYDALEKLTDLTIGKDSLLKDSNYNLFNGITNLTKELVIINTNYDEKYNAPFAKHLDDSNAHLTELDTHPNLYLKIYNTKDSNKVYYLHLASLGTLDIVKEKFGEGSNTYKNYKEFLNVKNAEISVDKKEVGVWTSTRLLTRKTNKVKDIIPNINIDELLKSDSKGNAILDLKKKFPGLYFYDGNKFSNLPKLKLFPTNFEDYKKLFTVSSFTSYTEKQLLKRFEYDKGKPYLAISFIKDVNQIQYIKMLSTNRTIEQLQEVFKDPFGNKSGSLSVHIRSKSKAEEALSIAGTMFSSSQVLDMLIDLAVDRPNLFNEFFSTGNDALSELAKTIAGNNLTDLGEKDMFSNLFKGYFASSKNVQEHERDLISEIFYAGKEDKLRGILVKIQKEVANGKTLDKKELRKTLLGIVGGKREKYWANKFWNIIRVSIELDTKIMKDNLLKEKFVSFDNTVKEMLKFWKESTNNKIYYNVPIKRNPGNENILYRLDDVDENLTHLYTTLIPEGPRLNVNLSRIFNTTVAKPLLTPEEQSNLDKALILAKIGSHSNLTQEWSDENLEGLIPENATLEELKDLLKDLDTVKPDLVDNTSTYEQNIDYLKNLYSVAIIGNQPVFKGIIENFLEKDSEEYLVKKDILDNFDKQYPLNESNILEYIADGKETLSPREIFQALKNDWNTYIQSYYDGMEMDIIFGIFLDLIGYTETQVNELFGNNPFNC